MFSNSSTLVGFLSGEFNIPAFKEAYRKVMHTSRQEHVFLKGFLGFVVGIILGKFAQRQQILVLPHIRVLY